MKAAVSYGDPAAVPVLYRIFGKAEHADAFAAGRVWISTLATCRAIEDAIRRDADEGTIVYRSGPERVRSDDPDFQEITRRSGLGFTNCGDVSILNCVQRVTTTDALVICMSFERIHKFGPYCVRIDKPVEMFNAVTEALESGGHIAFSPVSIKGAIHRIHYRPREYQYRDKKPVHAVFIKPMHFEDEREVRMLWPLNGVGPYPFELRCDSVRDYCTRIA